MNTMGLWRFLWRYFFPKKHHDWTGDNASSIYLVLDNGARVARQEREEGK